MDKKEKIFQNIMKFVFLAFFVFFLIVYFSGTGTYYENELHKKTLFTEEQIKKFEEDVANGKNVSIEDYIANPKENYSNKTSEAGLFLSKGITNYIKKGIEQTFKMISKFIE